MLDGSAYWARPSSTIRGAEPWIASNIEYRLPMFALPAVPTPPWNSAASSVRMSPYRFGSTITLKSRRRLLSTSFAVMMSMYQSSNAISGYSLAIVCAMLRNLPSVVFTTFAFVTAVTRPILFFRAYSNAIRMMRSDPCVVVTVKSTARSSVTLIPELPSTYAPSVFSRKNTQSIPSLGTLTGPHVGEEVEVASQRHVARFDVRPGISLSRRGRRALEQDVLFPDLVENVVGNRFAVLGPVLDRETVDDVENDFLGRDLLLEKELEDVLSVLGDVGADPVPAENADVDRVDLAEVDPFVLALHPLDPVELFADDFFEMSLRVFEIAGHDFLLEC